MNWKIEYGVGRKGERWVYVSQKRLMVGQMDGNSGAGGIKAICREAKKRGGVLHTCMYYWLYVVKLNVYIYNTTLEMNFLGLMY